MKCPQCGSDCERDEIDSPTGVGMMAIGPWGCPECHWFQKPKEPEDRLPDSFHSQDEG